jgi:hypothetical protein
MHNLLHIGFIYCRTFQTHPYKQYGNQRNSKIKNK